MLWNPIEGRGLSLFNVLPQKLLDSKAKFCTFCPRPVHCPEPLLRFTQCLTFTSFALTQNPSTGLTAKFGQYTAVTLLLLTEEALVVTCMISFWEVNIYGTFLSQLSVWFSGRSIWSAAGEGEICGNLYRNLISFPTQFPYFISDTPFSFQFAISIEMETFNKLFSDTLKYRLWMKCALFRWFCTGGIMWFGLKKFFVS